MVYLISFSHLQGRCASQLPAFGKATCKGKVACGIASQGLSNNQKDLEGGGLSFLGGRRAGLDYPGRPSHGSMIVLLLSLGQMGWN